MKKLISFLLILILALSLSAGALADPYNLYMAQDYLDHGLYQQAAAEFAVAGDDYRKAGMYAEALEAYGQAKYCYEQCNETGLAANVQKSIEDVENEMANNSKASTISAGSIWIIVAVAVVAVCGITALVIMKKKKTAAE